MADSNKFKWDIYWKGEYIGTALTNDRMTVLKKVVGDKLDTSEPGDIRFDLNNLGLKSDQNDS